MSIDTSKIPRDVSTNWMKARIPKNVADPEAYQAARGFESYFSRQLVKEMLSSTDFIGGKGHGGEVYQDMFKDMLGDQIATDGGLGITEMIYRQVMQNKGQKPYVEEGEGIKQLGPKALAELVPLRMAKYIDAVDHASKAYKIEPELLFAVMQQESGGDPNAESHAGAKGLMQLIDSTAADMGVQDVFDPVQNVHGGAKYLRQQIDSFGTIEHALAAYNAGPGAVRKYGGIPPYAETQDYVKRVKNIYGRLKDQIAQMKGIHEEGGISTDQLALKQTPDSSNEG